MSVRNCDHRILLPNLSSLCLIRFNAKIRSNSNVSITHIQIIPKFVYELCFEYQFPSELLVNS